MSEKIKEDKARLDFKRTICVGFAFMGIMIFWEVYDYIMPLILNNLFGLDKAQYGIVMGIDNALALFMLPLFGYLSDKAVNSKLGRRTSFILYGTIAACIGLVVLSFVEFGQYNAIVKAGVPEASFDTLLKYGLDEKYNTPAFIELFNQYSAKGATRPTGETLELFTEVDTAVHNAKIAFAADVTKNNPGFIGAFIAVVVLLLIAMGTYRSPAVALMPDVTPKPFRSQANALITLMGGAGSVASILLYSTLAKERYQHHIALFCTLAGAMIVILICFLCTVRENKLVAQCHSEEERWGFEHEEDDGSGNEKLSKGKMISLLLILGCVFLWFFGFNAVKSHLSVYATSVLKYSAGFVGTINTIALVGGAIALLPVAIMASKLGRKKTIIIGLLISLAAFISCIFINATTPHGDILFAVCFILAGFGLVCINVNTFPMVTELARGSNVGRYTGFYYIASMAAQTFTPALVGLVMEHFENQTYSLFIYSTVFIALSMLSIMFVKLKGMQNPLRILQSRDLPTAGISYAEQVNV